MEENVILNKTFSISLDHLRKVKQMVLITGKGQGELIRQAIDELYEKTIAQPPQTK